jgi:hypothetical protein
VRDLILAGKERQLVGDARRRGINRSIDQRSGWSAGQGRVRLAPAGSTFIVNIVHLRNKIAIQYASRIPYDFSNK